jgi:2,3-bisphosphoglycerate-independent phosphoglycerate mutase
MTEYDRTFALAAAFKPIILDRILAKVLAHHDLKNLRMAETEKYAHVTYFFNGGEEEPFPGERRVLIPSPKVATYDLKPEMSAFELTDRLLGELDRGQDDCVIVNYANADMVGHTGVITAACRAVEAVDQCLGRINSKVQSLGEVLMVTADHGNAEQMIDPATGGVHTAHTTNPVPFILVDEDFRGKLRPGCALRDVAPTMLDYLGLEKPTEMTGASLLRD